MALLALVPHAFLSILETLLYPDSEWNPDTNPDKGAYFFNLVRDILHPAQACTG